VLHRQGQFVDAAYFIMNGEVEVGVESDAYKLKKMMTKSKIKDLMANNMQRLVKAKVKKNMLAENIDKNIFPVSFGPKHPVGLFEMLFQIPAQFLYRIKDPERKWSLKSSFYDCLFIRFTKWRRIYLDKVESKMSQSMEDFQNSLTTDFVETLYFPFQNFKMDGEQLNKSTKQFKMQKNVIGLLLGSS
jgi:hypothetical protein